MKLADVQVGKKYRVVSTENAALSSIDVTHPVLVTEIQSGEGLHIAVQYQTDFGGEIRGYVNAAHIEPVQPAGPMQVIKSSKHARRRKRRTKRGN